MTRKKIFKLAGILSMVPRDFKDLGRAPVGKGEISLRRKDLSKITLKELWKKHLGCYINLSLELMDFNPDVDEDINISGIDIDEEFEDIYQWLSKRVLTYRERGYLFLEPKNYGEVLFNAMEGKNVIGIIGNKGRTISLRKLLDKYVGRQILLILKVKDN